MTQSILGSVKDYVGVPFSDISFDEVLLMHINSVFMILHQMGVGPENGFFAEDASVCWTDYTTDISKLALVKTYVCAKVKSIFDPPTVGAVSEALKNIIAEAEWRLNVAVDPGE